MARHCRARQTARGVHPRATAGLTTSRWQCVSGGVCVSGRGQWSALRQQRATVDSVCCAQAESICIGAAAEGSGCTGPSSSSARASLSTFSIRSRNCCRRSCMCREPSGAKRSVPNWSQAARIAHTSTVAAVAALSCSNAAMSCTTLAMAACVSARLGKARHCFRSNWRAGAEHVTLQP